MKQNNLDGNSHVSFVFNEETKRVLITKRNKNGITSQTEYYKEDGKKILLNYFLNVSSITLIQNSHQIQFYGNLEGNKKSTNIRTVIVYNLIKQLGISKVKLAKYLGVSRQMLYYYLSLNDIDKWPEEKKTLLFQLLNQKNNFASAEVNSELFYPIGNIQYVNKNGEIKENHLITQFLYLLNTQCVFNSRV